MKRRALIIRCIAAFLLLSVGVGAYAQTFYELSFHAGKNNDEFVGLLIYTDNEHCKMRLVDEEALAKNGYYESNYTTTIEAKKGKNDVGMMIMKPDNDDLPMLIWYWEKDDKSDKCKAPLLAYDLKDTKSWIKADDFHEVTLAEMDQAYVDQFYDKGTPEYKMLTKGIQTVKRQRIAKGVTDKPAGVLHLVIAANTEVSDIGQACSVDMRRIRSEFTGVAKVLGLTLDEHVIFGGDYGKAKVQEAVKRLTPAANDVVVFVYSGHGFRFKNQKDRYPCLDLTSSAYDKLADNFMPLSSIYSDIVAKGARLNIILSDCCNSEVTAEQPMVWSNSLFSRANTNFDLTKLEALFLKSSGNVIATAASPGELSWCGTNGGFFLLSFFESLRSQISALTNEAPSWDALINKTIAGAAVKTENNASCKKQNGLRQVELKK